MDYNEFILDQKEREIGKLLPFFVQLIINNCVVNFNKDTHECMEKVQSLLQTKK